MNYISTKDHLYSVSFSEAMFDGLAPKQGLYVPAFFPIMPQELLTDVTDLDLQTLGTHILSPFLTDIPHVKLNDMLQKALNFPIPLKMLDDQHYLLEVFHGPTLAFKDVGARFMAQAMAYFSTANHRKVTIIVATSGDTGSAIANAFHHAPNIEVFILYPSQKITLLQEMQMTTLGGNVHAVEVNGTFDDCQRLVKTALSDETLKKELNLTTSNSINIARLLPQMIYHAWGCVQLQQMGDNTAPCLFVPSGNLGNLTSAVYARQIGFSVHEFIAAINENKAFSDYLSSQQFTPRPSLKTLANAMDVGNPSNIERLQDFYHHDAAKMNADIKAISISNKEILEEIRRTYETSGMIIDPHTAVGLAASRKYPRTNHPYIITATAHPAKFPEVVREALNIDVEMPESLARLLSLPKQATEINADYEAFAELLSE